MGIPPRENNPMAMVAAKNGCPSANPLKAEMSSRPVILKKEINPANTSMLVSE